MRIGHASIDEKGKIAGGNAGDQTGKEVCVRNWYAKNWSYVLRCKSRILANDIAVACEKGCANDNIGYNQSKRNTLRKQAMYNNYDLAKITVPCECDCSSFMTVCVECAGIKFPTVGNNAPTTRTMKSAFLETGVFEVLTDSKYLTKPDYLLRGDILVQEGHHTVMVLDDGSVKEPQSSLQYEVGKTYTLQANMYVRATANGTKVDYDMLTADAKKNAFEDEYGCGILKKGTKITCKDVKTIDTSIWLKIPSGWVCAKNVLKTYIS